MEPFSPTIPIEDLLAHEPWLRRIVVDLVDDDEVDDILQETWIAALAERRIAHPRAWLKRVAHNLAMLRRRSAGRRRKREAAAARAEALPSTDAIVERLQAHKQLAEAVAELEEPYRTAVLLRYFEDIPPREIAARLGVPASTVRTRLERGLAKVRGRLRDEGGDVRALAVLILTPRFGEPVPPASLPRQVLDLGVGALAMAARHKVLSAAVVLASVTSISFLVRADSDDPVVDSGPELATVDVAAENPQSDPLPDARVEVGPPTEPASTTPPLGGRAIDTFGNAVPGLELEFRATVGTSVSNLFSGVVPADAASVVSNATCDALGRFEFDDEVVHGQIHAAGDYVTVRYHAPRADRRDREHAFVIVARRGSVRGVVRDESGEPLAGVTIIPKIGGLTHIDEPVDHMQVLGVRTLATDAEGAFALEDVPAIDELELSFSKHGYAPVERRAIDMTRPLEIELEERHKRASYSVYGIVEDRDGAPVEGAMVMLHLEFAMTNRHGEFELRTRYLGDESQFGAAQVGWQPALRPDVVQDLLNGKDPGEVVLRLGEPARSIDGVVVDTHGDPVAGLAICVLDGTQVQDWMTVEDYIGGRGRELDHSTGSSLKIDTRTDENGAFTVPGLTDRDYRVRAWDPKTLASTTHTVRAGDRGVTIELDVDRRRTFAGLLKTRAGVPIEGASVAWGLRSYDNGGLSIFSSGAGAQTDERGAFRLENIPVGDVELSISGRDITDWIEPLLGRDSDEHMVITPWARCRVRVSIGADGAARVGFLDGAGERLQVRRTMGQVSYGGDGWDLRDGATPALEVSQAARTLIVLDGDDGEIARHAVALRTGLVERLEF